MHDENKTKLITIEEAAAALDAKRDYRYGYSHDHAEWQSDATTEHLRDYWKIIRRRLWIPISMVMICVTIAGVYNLRLPSIYEGVTRIEVDRDERVVSLKDMQINMGGGDDIQYINTQIKVLQSRRVAYLIATTLDLEHNPEFTKGMSGFTPSGNAIEFESEKDDEQAEMKRLEPLIQELLRNVDVRPIRDTRLIEIHYRHRVPDIARKISDTWAEAFKKNNLDQRYKENREAGSYLEKTIADSKLKVKEAEEKLLQYRKSNEIIDFSEEDNTVIARLGSLNQLLLDAETARKNAQLTYELSKTVSDLSTIPEVQNDELVRDLKKKLGVLVEKRSELTVEFTSEWPEVKKISQQISELESQLRAAYRRILVTIENNYKTALQKEDLIKASFDAQRRETLSQNEGAITAKIFQQEAETNRQMLERLLESQQGIQVSGPLMKSNIRISEYSPPADYPVAPKRLQNVLLTAILSLIGGIGLALFLDYINNKIDSVDDVNRYMRLPLLGVIPLLENSKKPRRLTGDTEASKDLAPVSTENTIMLTEMENSSPIAESYRQLRTSLLLSSAGRPPKTMLFTSSQPAEGKTTTSVNTAISLAQTGSSVLIIDADLRRPRVHKVFNLRNNAGLSNYLTGEGDLASLIQNAMPNLYVLPVGPLPPNPAELLGSLRMKYVMETAAESFDYIVIDSPPVSSFADSLILSSLVEGVIIVVKGGSTPRETAQRTKNHLLSVGAKVLGVVINQIKLQPNDYYYSSYYSRCYYSVDNESVKAKAAKS